MAKNPDLPKKLHAYLCERWTAAKAARDLGEDEKAIKELLKNRRFLDRTLFDTVQKWDPQYGQNTGMTLREIMEANAADCAMEMVTIAKTSERDDTRLKACKAVVELASPKQTTHLHRHEHGIPMLTNEQRSKMLESAKEADNLMPVFDVKGEEVEA